MVGPHTRVKPANGSRRQLTMISVAFECAFMFIKPVPVMDSILHACAVAVRIAAHVSNRNRKLHISRAPTKVKSQEPGYSQTLNQNKINRQRSRCRESGRQTVRRLWWMVLGVETGREARGRR